MRFEFATIIFLTASTALTADPVSLNPRPRMMGMGNAGAGLIGDRDSAMMNPAGLADVETARFEVLPLLIEVPFSIGTVNSYLDLQDALDNDSNSKAVKRQKLEEFLSDVASEAVSTRININPSYTRKNLHIGASLDFLVNPRFHVGGIMSNQVVDLGGANGTAAIFLAYAYSFLDDHLKVGATLKPIYRVALTTNQEQTVYDLIKGQDPGTDIGKQILGETAGDKKAFGVGFDLGARYDLPILESIRPSVGVTYQDIGDTRFFGDNTPSKIDQSVSLGLAVHPRFGFIDTAFAFDLRSINRNEEFLNKIHFGAEAVFWKLMAVRAGLSQLYWTVGLGLDLRFFEFDVFITARESGRFAHLREDRTLGTRLSFAF